MKRKEPIKKVKSTHIIIRSFGFMLLFGCLALCMVIFISFFIYGGIILYENNILIRILEFSMVFFALVFTLYLFKKLVWNKENYY